MNLQTLSTEIISSVICCGGGWGVKKKKQLGEGQEQDTLSEATFWEISSQEEAVPVDGACMHMREICGERYG